MSGAGSFDNPGSALEEEFRDHADALMTVNAEAVLSVFKEILSPESGEDICIASIERKDMSTEQMLSMLAEDESVVFAEPNYCVSVEPVADADEEMLQGLKSGLSADRWHRQS